MQSSTSSKSKSKTISKSKKQSNKVSITSPAMVPEEGEESQLVPASKKQEKRLVEMYKTIQDMEDKMEIDNLIEEITLGRGIIHLMDENLKKDLQLEGPYLKTQVFNNRGASAEDVKKLWAKMGCGNNLQSKVMAHEVIIGVTDEEDIGEEWSKRGDQMVIWSDKGKKGSMILINGNHRLEVIKRHLLEKGLKELQQFSKEKDKGNAQKLRAEMILKAQWSAKLIDMDKINKITNTSKRNRVIDRLSKNNLTYTKPDSVIERISNMGSWLLTEETPPIMNIMTRLATESKEIIDTNKSQKGVLQDIALVLGICAITQLEYFRQPGQLKVAELNASRAFACPMIMPLVIIGAKFYMDLTLPTPVHQHKTKNHVYEEIDLQDMVDSRLQLKILDASFFSGLDKLFLDHLFPSFQTFGITTPSITEYDQNNAPSLEDEEEHSENVEEEIVSLDWINQFKMHYIPAVETFVAKWVMERKKILCSPTEGLALDALADKVKQFVTMGEKKTGMRTVPWHADRIGVPLVTPFFISAITSELNEVEDAAISLLVLLEPMAWLKIKTARSHNSSNFVKILELWAKGSSKEERLTTRRVMQILLAARHTGLAKLTNYLRDNKFNPEQKTFPTKFNGEGGTHIDGLETWTNYDLDVLALNNLMAKIRRLQTEDDRILSLDEEHFEQYLQASTDKNRANAICCMMMGSYIPWGKFSSKEFAKVGAKQSKDLFQSYERARHTWEAIEKISEVKALWTKLFSFIRSMEGYMWVSVAKWEISPEKEIVQEQDESLQYLAPLQQNMAMQAKAQMQKGMVDKMNRIMMDTLSIAGVEQSDGIVLPEEQLSYCALNQINSFDSKKKMKELDSLTMPQIQSQLNQQGLRSEILDQEVISKIAWKQTISLPKGKDFEQAIMKRSGIHLQKKGPKRQKKIEEDIVMESEEGKEVDAMMSEEPVEQGPPQPLPPNHQDQDVDMENDEISQEQDRSVTPEPPTCGQPIRGNADIQSVDLLIPAGWHSDNIPSP